MSEQTLNRTSHPFIQSAQARAGAGRRAPPGTEFTPFPAPNGVAPPPRPWAVRGKGAQASSSPPPCELVDPRQASNFAGQSLGYSTVNRLLCRASGATSSCAPPGVKTSRMASR